MDATNLVKSYAMVNVAQYQIVATGATVSACERTYVNLLSERGVIHGAGLPAAQDESSGAVAEIRTAVLGGTSWYYIRLEDEDVFYAVSAEEEQNVIVLDVGDEVTIQHAAPDEGEAPSILEAYSLTVK